jgi:hypothetical protein
MPNSPLDKHVQPFGFPTYDHYLRSKQWREFKERYKNSELPQHCIGCGEVSVQLHHTTYVRVCREELDDVVPLCGLCHMAEHKIERRKVKKRKKPRFCKLCTTERDTPGPCSCRVKPCLDCGRPIDKNNKREKCNKCFKRRRIHNGENRSFCYICKKERFPELICQCIQAKPKIKPKSKIKKDKPKKNKGRKPNVPPTEFKIPLIEHKKVERTFCDTCKRQMAPMNHCVCSNFSFPI